MCAGHALATILAIRNARFSIRSFLSSSLLTHALLSLAAITVYGHAAADTTDVSLQPLFECLGVVRITEDL